MTCNNTSNNDTMVEQLSFLLPEFDGNFNQVCCFAHIVNLVAKLLLRQSDVQKVQGSAAGKFDDNVKVLFKLAEGLEEEEEQVVAEKRQDGGDLSCLTRIKSGLMRWLSKFLGSGL